MSRREINGVKITKAMITFTWINISDKDFILYHKLGEDKFCIVIPNSLIPAVLKYYHHLSFTTYQGEARTIDLS
jgi:hypothetical protein